MADNVEVRPQGERELVISRRFAARREVVFDCFTKPELIQQWLFGPGGWTLPVCEVDLREGGSFRYVWRHAGKPDMGMSGRFEVIQRPARIVHREVFDQDWTGGETLVTTEFEEDAGITTVTMTVEYSSAKAREGALKTGMTDGMEATYQRLDALLGSSGGDG